MNVMAENRLRRLADALSAVKAPLAPLFEYAGDLEQHLNDGDEIEVSCIAALLRARAGEVKRDITRCLEELEEAASRVACA